MVLNHDCVRAVLMYLEDNLLDKRNGASPRLKVKSFIGDEYFDDYKDEDVLYSVKKLAEAKFIKVMNINATPKNYIVQELSWKGHEYLDSIRDEKVWKEVKDRTKEITGVSFEILKTVGIEIIKSKLGLMTSS